MTTTENTPTRPTPPKLATTMPIGYMLVRPGDADEDALMADWDGVVWRDLDAARAELQQATVRPLGYHLFALFRLDGECRCED